MSNIREYYTDLRNTEKEFQRNYPAGVVHVTSLFNRDRGSTAGTTTSATCYNAARVVTDGTHRLSTPEEIEAFEAHQQRELIRNQAAEQRNKKQYLVVLNQDNQAAATIAAPTQPKPSQAPVLPTANK